MKRGGKIALGCIGLFILVCGMSLWGIWAATGHGAAIYKMMGHIALSCDNNERAAEYFARGIDRQPNNAGLHLYRGYALGESGNTAEALEEYQEAARLDPGSAEPLLRQADLHVEDDQYPEALDALEQALERDPDSAPAHMAYGSVLVALERTDEAIPEFERAVELDRHLGGVHFALGQAYEDSGEQSKAIRTYRAGAQCCDQQCRERLAELGKPYSQDEETIRASAASDNEWEDREMNGAAGAIFFAVFFAAYIVFFGVMILFTLVSWLATVLAAWDCSRRDFVDPNTRAIWCVLIVMTRWLGALIYYLVVYRRNDPPIAPRPPAPSRHS